MAKKRKASRQTEEHSSGRNLDVGSSRKRIRDFEDVAGSDDEFHINRDKVLLDEGSDAKRRRQWQEQEDFLEPSDEEVLEYSDGEDEDEQGLEKKGPRPAHSQQGLASDFESSGDGDQGDEDGLRWGMSREDLYGADVIETEEQALEEEAEALRLQKKQLQSMTAADYGFDESEWQDTSAGNDAALEDDDNVVTEVLPQLQVADDMVPAERLKLLKSRYPEFEPLSKELLNLKDFHPTLLKDIQLQDSQASQDDLPHAFIKFRAASAYLGALTIYFALLTSPAFNGQLGTTPMSANQLRDHPVMDSLVRCRELWLRAMNLAADPKPSTADTDILALANGTLDEEFQASQQQGSQEPLAKKSRAQRHAEAAQAAADARRAERIRKTEVGLADLNALITPSAMRKSTKSKHAQAAESNAESDVVGDAPLSAHEAAEKAKRKKSLRFYTSQITQKANKRGAAGRNAGGDDDIPHRERLKDRQARLNAEAEKRGRRNVDPGAELGGESDEDDLRQAKEVPADAEDGDYYDLVAIRTAKKKADKAAFAEAQKQAALQGGQVIQEETVGPDGKRKISYAIEKNKGLTPHRKKEVRNPRVKKRKKYDEKKKKLGSIKPVYKGGEGRGGYGGELTGIKKGLVKSTKL